MKNIIIALNIGVHLVDHLWWHDSVIYQIYPHCFADGNGNGLGDLPGIISRLDHLAVPGIGAIWLSPIYQVPTKTSAMI
jgi:glycosidase